MDDGDDDDNDETKDTNKKITETYTHLSIRKKERKKGKIDLATST
jgi:hypothetical protein